MKLMHAAPLFAAVGDDTRLKVVARLRTSGSLSVARLTAGTSVSRQAITKHLHTLEQDAGLAGRFLDQLSVHWDDAVERLRTLVEHEEP